MLQYKTGLTEPVATVAIYAEYRIMEILELPVNRYKWWMGKENVV